MEAVAQALTRHLSELVEIDPDDLVSRRREKYYEMGAWRET
jgi:acetyl-CoA carboxylase alpha subunit